MSKKPFALIILLGAGVVLWATVRLWLPWLINLLPETATLETWATLVQGLEAFVNLLLLLINGLIALLLWRSRNGIPPEGTLDSPLRHTNWEKLLERLGERGGQVPWIDRGKTSAGILRAYGRLLIRGRKGIGKTREAAELIRRVVSEEFVSPDRVFVPSEGFHQIDAAAIRSAVRRNLDLTSPILLYLEDLPRHFFGEGLARLAELLENIRECPRTYVVADARDDQIAEEHRTWLKKQDFFQINLPKLNDAQSAELLDAAAGIMNLRLTEGAKSALVRIAAGIPDLILMPLLRLLAHKAVEVDEGLARNFARQEQSEAWAETRRDICELVPAAYYLIDGLVQFHVAAAPAHQVLVLHYASYLWAQRRKWWAPSCLRIRSLRRALGFLTSFDFAVVDEVIAFRDHIIEDDSRVKESPQVLSFLLTHRDFFQKRWIRLLYKNARVHAEALFALAYAVQEKGENEQARDAYAAAIRLLPHPWLHNNLGLAHFELGDTKSALASFNHAVKLAPKNGVILVNRGRAQVELGNVHQGIADYNCAVDLEPDYVIAYYNRGLAFAKLNDLENAIEDWTRAIELNPDFSDAYNSRGAAYANRGDVKLARTDFNRSITLNPKYPLAYSNRAQARLLTGRELEHALADSNRAIELDPRYLDAYFIRGDIRAVLGDLGGAIEDCSYVIELDPNHPEAYNNRGWYFLRQYDLNNAEQDFQERVRLNPANAFGAHVGLGVIARARGDLVEARRQFEQAMSVWNANWEKGPRAMADSFGLLVGKGVALLCLGQTTKAMQTLVDAKRYPGKDRMIPSLIEVYKLIAQSDDPPAGIDEFVSELLAIERR